MGDQRPATAGAGHRRISGSSLSRVIGFSDGVVAVAITLLALPLAAINIPADMSNPFQIVTDNWPAIIAFVLTFVIVFFLWQGHHRVFENFVAIDNAIMWWNALWLLTIVLLPWPSRLLDLGSQSRNAVWLYCATLCINALALHMIFVRGRRHPDLLRPGHAEWNSWVSISLIFAVLFAIMTAVSFLAPRLALSLLWLFIPLRLIMQQDGRLRSFTRRTAEKA